MMAGMALLVFFSYAQADAPLATLLAEGLRSKGVDVWIDFIELRVGDSLQSRIPKTIEEATFVVALISPHSVESRWCTFELSLAMAKELENGRVVVLPLRVGDVRLPASLRDKLCIEVDVTKIETCVAQLALDIRKHLSGEPRIRERIRSDTELTIEVESEWEMPPKFQAALRAKLAVLHAWRRSILDLEGFFDTPDGRFVHATLDRGIRSILADEGGAEHSTAWLGNHLLEEIDEVGRLATDPDAKLLLAELRDSLLDMSPEDHLARTFSLVSTLAQGLYGEAWSTPRLTVARFARERRVDVTTAVHDGDSREVKVIMNIESLSPVDFATLPQRMAHACIVHLINPLDGTADSVFLEGFMDWASRYFCSRWASSVDPLMASSIRQLATRPMFRAPEVQGRMQRLGSLLAENLVNWLERTGGLNIADSQARVAQLAVDLNKVDRPVEMKDDFVLLCHHMSISPVMESRLLLWLNDRMTPEQLLDETIQGRSETTSVRSRREPPGGVGRQ
jgi:hypothetical protein